MNKVTDVIIAVNSVISLHIQLHNQLRQIILSGRWPHASRIPSESQFVQHLNISRSTVRLALQQAEIEGLIERIAGRGTFVAYQPSKERQNRLIAFVTCGFDGESDLLMLSGAENEVKAHGYQIIFNNVRGYQEEIELLTRYGGEDIAGVLLWPSFNSAQSQEENSLRYQQIHLPTVLMDRQICGSEWDCVTSDNYAGAAALMEHLIGLGHRHIVFLTHHQTELLPVAERYRAYCDVLHEAGLTQAEPWLIGDHGNEITAASALRSSIDAKSAELQQIKDYLTNAQPRPTAIFALNDYIAVLAMRAMKLINLQVPHAISVAGFDDIDLAMHLEVPLTTVAQDPFAIGKRAAQLLIARLQGFSGPANCERIPTQIRIRSSTSAPFRD
jgi:GntR family transcriptional regulator, arabinose operon transcriptional repressor